MNLAENATKPPMGWNSWDCFGVSVTEADIRENAEYMARHLKQYGWEYVVVDLCWFAPDARTDNYKTFGLDQLVDEYGRLIPAPGKFPSSAGGAGFKPLAQYVHHLGLKFGIHIMRGIPWQAACFLVLTLIAVCSIPAAKGELRVYPDPSGLNASSKYEVELFDGAKWVPSYVNFDVARTSGSGSGDEPGKTFSWTTFETTAPLAVRVRRSGGGFGDVVIRPKRHGIAPTIVTRDTVEFTIQPGQKLSVEFDTEIKESCYDGSHGIPCVKNIMMIFADSLKPASAIDGVPAADIYRVSPGSHETTMPVAGTRESAGKCTLGTADGRRVVVFGPGVYDIGYWQVPNSIEHIHFAGGAVVFGAIDVIPQGRSPFYDRNTIDQVYRSAWRSETLRPSFKITGPGILSGAKLPWHLTKDFSCSGSDDWSAHVKLVQLAVEHVTFEDVTMANSPHWVLTFIKDDDPRTQGLFDNFKMVGAWTYNNDGLPNPTGPTSVIRNAFIHADDDTFKIYNSDSKIHDCVVWQGNNGAVFQFGWFPKTCSNVAVSNIDVIHFENWYGVHQVNRAVFNYANSNGNGTIGNMDFTNIQVEGKVLRLFGFNCGRQVIRDFTFTNLTCDGMGVGNLGAPGANYFIGNISNWTFNDFSFAGNPVVDASQVQFEFAGGAGNGFVFNSPRRALQQTGGQGHLRGHVR